VSQWQCQVTVTLSQSVWQCYTQCHSVTLWQSQSLWQCHTITKRLKLGSRNFHHYYS